MGSAARRLGLEQFSSLCERQPGAVEIESQWTARKREQAGVFLTVRTRSCEEKLPPKRSLDGAPS